MKNKNIRNSVFETNSSSTHSISIIANAEGILDTLVPNDDGELVLSGGSFGWSWEKFNDAATKANYCAVDAFLDSLRLHMLTEVLVDHTGAKKVIYAFDYAAGDVYVDHQSEGTSADAFSSPQRLKDFIFNPNSWLFTGNDNDYAPPNFYDVDKNIVYTHELQLDGLDYIVKLQAYPDIESESFEKIIQQMGGKHPLMERKYYDHFNNSEEYRAYKPWCFYSYKYKLADGSYITSMDKMKEGLITLFKTEEVYGYDPEEVSKRNPSGKTDLGDRVIESMDIKFSIVPL